MISNFFLAVEARGISGMAGFLRRLNRACGMKFRMAKGEHVSGGLPRGR